MWRDHWWCVRLETETPLNRRGNIPSALSGFQNEGYKVWLDTERMAGAAGQEGLSHAMSLAIQASSAVVVCFSASYAMSDNCHGELTFAKETRKPRFYVNVGPPGYTPKSYLDGAHPHSGRGVVVPRCPPA